MAGGKAALPAPIDRPLSRAYLRQFKGWSTAYPPGVSEPTSLRVMENMLVNRDGSIKIRPGLKMLSEKEVGFERGRPALPVNQYFISSQEPFYLNNGNQAWLTAILNDVTDRVEFRVFILDTAGQDRWILVDLDAFNVAFDVGAWDGDDPHFTSATTYVRFLQIDNKILALSNAGEELIVFYVGATKKVTRPKTITKPEWNGLAPGNSSAPILVMPQYDWAIAGQNGYPAAATEYGGANTLISSDPTENHYNYAVFYTYGNELGESEPSEIGQVKLQRPLGGWLWETTGVPAHGYGSMFPSGTQTTEPAMSADRLALVVPGTASAGFAQAVADGATSLNFYIMSWSDQAPVPVEAWLIAKRELTDASTLATHGWYVLSPGDQQLGSALPVPNKTNRYNSTKPSRAGQGLVAADRLVLVNDPTAAAVIRWTTNEMGNYLNFAPSHGGGYKTLTSGNMQVPACVKLWQNPQSADTLTILCRGTDSYSSTYYMAPASVSSQSDNTVVMGVEETTATLGTTSPYGCEVANNALYHPLDDQLMKSTASNYNINHKSMTDQIAPQWQRLVNKQKIVSCFFDQRLYYLVHNPDGAELEDHCSGNEVWVLDLSSEGGTWARWLTQGVSLRKVEVEGRVYLSLIRPDGVFLFDEQRSYDDVVEADRLAIAPRSIPWRMETNTQGANRAHDAFAHLRQVSVTFGNFTGFVRYGVRALDIQGRRLEAKKEYHQLEHVLTGGLPFDAIDHLGVARDVQEWFFFAESMEDEGEPRSSYGQISLVQYRYVPISVNVGYDFGQVETFEYGRDTLLADSSVTDNGVPQPYLDTART